MTDIAPFASELLRFLPKERIITDDMAVHVMAVDSSPYAPACSLIADIEDLDELKKVQAAAVRHNISVTYRGSGTAVSGQATAQDVLIRLRGPKWKGVTILEGGRYVKALCATRGGEINQALAPYGRVLGTDPATLAVATIGGMSANNSAGMSCTVEKNIFHRLHAMEFMLADGTYVDTADAESRDAFAATHTELLDRLSMLREKLTGNDRMRETVIRKYRIRNTSGYSLNALTDYDDPFDILMHLLIGSEGTLGLILSVTLETEPLLPLRASCMVGFTSIDEAMKAVVAMRSACDMHACEFYDDPTLRLISAAPGFPEQFRPAGEGTDECALLLEVRGALSEELSEKCETVVRTLADFETKVPPEFSTDPDVIGRLWAIRSALLPILSAGRKPTEFEYSEDYCVPIDKLPEACHAFVEIMRELDFTGGVNGHALHGNLHCALNLDTGDPADVARLGRFIEWTATTVLRLGGSLKGEHGTGRAIAPYVRREWGDELYGIMLDIKNLLDPDGILNRGVLLNDSPRSHLKGLKEIGQIGLGLDRCMDCGFCEPVCPSEKIGLGPRQRIFAMRSMAAMKKRGETERLKRWEKDFRFMGRDLCATDGLCTKLCPLGMDVASAMRSLRHDGLSLPAKAAAGLVCSHMSRTVSAASGLLGIAAKAEGVMGHDLSTGAGKLAGKVIGMTMPDLRQVRLRGGSKIPTPAVRGRETIVYFPSCAVRAMGYSGDSGRQIDPLMDVVLRLLDKAGFDAVIPPDVQKLCCGKAFETKGMAEQAAAAASELNSALLAASRGGEFPVVCDTSPCLARMKKTLDPALKLYEPIEFTLEYLVPRLSFTKKFRKVALHPTCSTRSMGLAEKMREAALLCAEEAVIPEGIQCCGFSGDKGFTRPELNAAALKTLADQVSDCEAGYSTSRTCEIGLTLHSGKFYSNLLYLIDECTEAGAGTV